MKTTDSVKHHKTHKTHKHTLSGFALGGILLAISAYNIYLLKDPKFNPLLVYVTLIPGALLVIRSLRPHIGVLRIIMTLLGGTLAGITPLLLTTSASHILWLGLVCGLVGAVCLGIGFSTKPLDI